MDIKEKYYRYQVEYLYPLSAYFPDAKHHMIIYIDRIVN